MTPNKFIIGLLFASLSFSVQASTLTKVKQRGQLSCGVSQSLPGFSFPDDKGNWSGIDVDVCRAISAAIFNDPNKILFVPLSAKERFTALQSGEIDVLSRNTTWTYSRDVALGLEFTNVTYYDGQGFMVRKNSGIKSAKELSGATVCTNAGTTTELNITDYFKSNNMQYQTVSFEKADEVVAAYNAGRCDVYSTDRSGLAAQRLKLSKPDEHMILPETISKEPLGPVVRHDDNKWADLVRWVFYGMVNAEEYGITQKNVGTFSNSNNPNIQRLLGHSGNLGEALGLNKYFMLQVITHVGNYGDSFERNVGTNSLLGLDRGINQLWTNGGVLYAPPFR